MNSINDLWIVSVTVLNMSGVISDNTITNDFYFTEKQKATDCFNYFRNKKLVCGLSMDRFIDIIQLNIDYKRGV